MTKFSLLFSLNLLYNYFNVLAGWKITDILHISSKRQREKMLIFCFFLSEIVKIIIKTVAINAIVEPK
jgi:hypothetical protein